MAVVVVVIVVVVGVHFVVGAGLRGVTPCMLRWRRTKQRAKYLNTTAAIRK